MNKTWLDNFPSDVQVEILKRLPFKTLVALMTTSRPIYSIVTSPTLMLTTLVRETGYYIYSYPSSNGGEHVFSVYRDTENKLRFVKSIDSISIDSNYFFLGSIYGLVCFAKKFGRVNDCDIILWNPFLGISRTLPFLAAACEKSYGLGLGLGFGFDHSSVDHKVVRIGILSNYSTRVWADVYGLRAKKWLKVTGSVSRPALSIIGDGIFMTDSLHWILKFTRFYGGQNYDEYAILTYDLAKNVFNEMEIDKKIIGYNKRMVLTKLTINDKEKLVLYRNDDQDREVCVWVMEEYNVAESWREIRIFFENNVQGESVKVLHTRKNGDIVISTSNGVLLSYAIEGNKTTTRFKIIEPEGPQLDYVGPLMGSLVFVDERGGGSVCGKRVEDEESKNNTTQKRVKDLNGGYYCFNQSRRNRIERQRSLDGKIQENVNLMVKTEIL